MCIYRWWLLVLSNQRHKASPQTSLFWSCCTDPKVQECYCNPKYSSMKIDSYAALHKICVGAQRETEHIYKIRPSAVTSDLFLIVSTVCSLLDFICHLLIGGSLCNTVTLNSQPTVYHTIGTWSILIHLKEAMVVLCGGERSGSILKRGIVSASCTVKKNLR